MPVGYRLHSCHARQSAWARCFFLTCRTSIFLTCRTSNMLEHKIAFPPAFRLASRLSPLASRLSPLASRLSPLASRRWHPFSLFASRLSPLASRLSTLAPRLEFLILCLSACLTSAYKCCVLVCISRSFAHVYAPLLACSFHLCPRPALISRPCFSPSFSPLVPLRYLYSVKFVLSPQLQLTLSNCPGCCDEAS
jgi:hypothetical protein